jgi:hypothetical protein
MKVECTDAETFEKVGNIISTNLDESFPKAYCYL